MESWFKPAPHHWGVEVTPRARKRRGATALLGMTLASSWACDGDARTKWKLELRGNRPDGGMVELGIGDAGLRKWEAEKLPTEISLNALPGDRLEKAPFTLVFTNGTSVCYFTVQFEPDTRTAIVNLGECIDRSPAPKPDAGTPVVDAQSPDTQPPGKTPCQEYCEITNRNCTGENKVFNEDDDCPAICERFGWEIGARVPEGNTLGCRLYYAEKLDCVNASLAAPDCFNPAAIYCGIATKTCRLFSSEAECREAKSRLLPKSAVADIDSARFTRVTSGNSLACRIHYLARATEPDSDECRWGSLSSESGPCQ